MSKMQTHDSKEWKSCLEICQDIRRHIGTEEETGRRLSATEKRTILAELRGTQPADYAFHTAGEVIYGVSREIGFNDERKESRKFCQAELWKIEKALREKE